MKLTKKHKQSLIDMGWELLPLGEGGSWIWLKSDEDGNNVAKEGDKRWKWDIQQAGVKSSGNI